MHQLQLQSDILLVPLEIALFQSLGEDWIQVFTTCTAQKKEKYRMVDLKQLKIYLNYSELTRSPL